MDRFETYAESKFIVDLCETKPNDDLSEEFDEWKKIFNIIAKKSILCINSKDELFNKYSENPIVRNLIKTTQGGGSKLLVDKGHFDKIVSDKLDLKKTSKACPIFCLSESKNNYNTGVFIANSKNYLEEFGKVTRESYSKSVSKNETEFSWSNLLDNHPPLNSIIIADPYLIKESDFDKNLFPILDKLIPNKNFEETFHITLITGSKANQSSTQLNNKYGKIQNFIGSKISDFKLGLYVVDQGRGPGKMMHDRMLITNYFYITSGKGFNLFNSDEMIKDDTILTWSAICTSDNLHTINEELLKLLGYVSKCHNIFPSMPQIIGDKYNRLLNIIEV